MLLGAALLWFGWFGFNTGSALAANGTAAPAFALEALFKAEVYGLALSRVQGHGRETQRVETYRGTTVKMELMEKVRLDIGVCLRSVRRDHR